jgi:uncharacterized membrane protein (DUF106 family)
MILEMLNDMCMAVADPIFGWLLHLPRDLALLVVAIGTSAILTFVRLWTTDQDLLKRCDADKARLNELMAEAKRAKDKDALARYRASTGAIAMKLMRAEGKPLLAALLPIALMATWCFNRIAYYPPTAEQPVRINAFFPETAIGQVVHMLPQAGLAADRLIATVQPTPDAIPGQEGEASWTVSAAARPDSAYPLEIRHAGRVYASKLLVGAREYAPTITFFNGPEDRLTVMETVLKPYRMFGFIHIPWGQIDLFFPPWMLAYLLIAIPFAFIFKGIFRIL